MNDPIAERPHIPAYGQIPTSTEGMVDWPWAVERLVAAMTYWFATTGSDDMPHLVPLWGAWVDGGCFVEGGNTRWQRNLRENANASVKVEIGSDVVLVEGTVIEHVAPPAALSDALVAGFAKYQALDYDADPLRWTDGGLWELRPRLAFAWSKYPQDMARFRFGVGLKTPALRAESS